MHAALEDMRDVSFCQEFDLVLNMADGAIGYLENEMENLPGNRKYAKVTQHAYTH